MPPRIPWQASGPLRQFRTASRANSEVCILCRFHNFTSRRAPPKSRWPKLSALQARQYTEVSPVTNRTRTGESSLNSKLHDALIELQKSAGNYVDLSKLQLALRGLEQGPGKEIIRIAVMGIAGKQDSLATVKTLLRLVLADPLKEEQEWERILLNESADKPVLLRFGAEESKMEGSRIKNNLIQEIYIHSPTLATHGLEILILETAQPDMESGSDILVPTIEIPMSSTGRYTPITTPVHKALIIGDGLLDTATIAKISEEYDADIVGTALNLPGYTSTEKSAVPFQVIDINKGNTALSAIRQSVENALTYEHQWFQSNLPSLLTWLKSNTTTIPPTIKPPVLNLISSLLNETSLKIQTSRASQIAKIEASKIPPPVLQSLRKELETWAERAHTELRDELDIAFQGHRWRKLSWYKLFWRVDDVGHLCSDILTQRFLVSAEQEIIHLAGKIEQAGLFSRNENLPTDARDFAFQKPVGGDIRRGGTRSLGTTPPPPKLRDLAKKVPDDTDSTQLLSNKTRPWPLDIPHTRTHLILDTIPALQALAQRLVLQTTSTSTLSTVLAGLLWFSELPVGGYGAGAVAALGTVWSLKRMEEKWEGARGFWEGEVREEGRGAVRGVEGVVGSVLVGREKEAGGDEGGEELVRAGKAVERVRGVIGEMDVDGKREGIENEIKNS